MALPCRIRDDGFATPAAVLISLAVAIVALGLEARAILAVHASERVFERTADEAMLAGAQRIVSARLSGSQAHLRSSETIALAGRTVRVRLESEGSKLGFISAARLPGSVLKGLGAEHVAAVQNGLRELDSQAWVRGQDIDALDGAPRWRNCARRRISAYGHSVDYAASSQAPSRAVEAHVGEVWRVVAEASSGWTDDRTVRIVGREDTPTHLLDRSFYRQTVGEHRVDCPT